MVDRALTGLMPEQGRRALTPEESAEINDVLDAAAEWAAGRLPWQTAAQVGTILSDGRPSAGYSRFLARFTCSPSDPRRRHLIALQDYLDAAQGLQITDKGTLTQRDLNDIFDAQDMMRRAA